MHLDECIPLEDKNEENIRLDSRDMLSWKLLVVFFFFCFFFFFFLFFCKGQSYIQREHSSIIGREIANMH